MTNDNEWVRKSIATSNKITPKQFFRKVEINAQGGGISNVNVTQSYKGDGK